jgi:hypothetical protein
VQWGCTEVQRRTVLCNGCFVGIRYSSHVSALAKIVTGSGSMS